MLAVLVLAGLFFFGTRLPGLAATLQAGPSVATSTSTSTSTPSGAPEPTPSPTGTPAPISTAGPQLAGTFDWNELRGGECIDPYTSAWQQSFTVVDCAKPHHGQLLSTGPLSVTASEAYPGQSAIAEKLNVLCTAPTMFDAAILATFPDVVLQSSYPVNAAQWNGGTRNYYCFVSRSSSAAFTGDFAPAAFGG